MSGKKKYPASDIVQKKAKLAKLTSLYDEMLSSAQECGMANDTKFLSLMKETAETIKRVSSEITSSMSVTIDRRTASEKLKDHMDDIQEEKEKLGISNVPTEKLIKIVNDIEAKGKLANLSPEIINKAIENAIEKEKNAHS